MSTCPKCKSKIGKENKTWKYGRFTAHFYICPKCGAQFRDYTKGDRLYFTLSLMEDGKYRKAVRE